MPALLEAKGLRAAYGPVEVLRGLDFEVLEDRKSTRLNSSHT